VLDYRDLVALNPVVKMHKYTKVLYRSLERLVLSNASLIFAIGEQMRNTIQKQFKERCHIAEEWCGYASDKTTMDSSIVNAFDREKYNIVHLGTIYPDERNPEILFTAIRKIQQNKNLLWRKLVSLLQWHFWGRHVEQLCDWRKNSVI